MVGRRRLGSGLDAGIAGSGSSRRSPWAAVACPSAGLPAPSAGRPLPTGRPPGSRSRCRPGPRGRRIGRVQALEPAQLGDELGQAAALDELHGVVGHAPLAADGVDRDDVGVVQAGGGLGLELEPLELPGVQRRGQRQDLRAPRGGRARSARPRRRPPCRPGRPRGGSGSRPARRPQPRVSGPEAGDAAASRAADSLQLGHHLQGGDQLPERLGVLGVAADECLQVHGLAGLEPSVSSSIRAARVGSAWLSPAVDRSLIGSWPRLRSFVVQQAAEPRQGPQQRGRGRPLR